MSNRKIFDGTCSPPVDAEMFQVNQVKQDLTLPLPNLFGIPILINENLPDGMFIIISNSQVIKVVLDEMTDAEWKAFHDHEDF